MTHFLFSVVALVVLMLTGLHVAAAIYLLAWGGDAIGPDVLFRMGGIITWNTVNAYILVAIPLFILVGEILLRSGLTDRLYTALSVWMHWLPGRLLHTNIVACTLFAATSGSSVATAATIGTVAVPGLRARGYNERLTLGSLAAGGTLGILVPPSINMIIYGALTDASIGRLFAAGVIPAIVLALIMSGIIAAIALCRPDVAGEPEAATTLRERVRQLPNIIPVAVILTVIMGSIYTGLATPTEAAALALVASLILAAMTGRLSVRMLHEAFRATIRTTAMVLLILVAAFMLNFVLGFLGIPQALSSWIRDLGLSPYATIWTLVVFYLILGCFLEAVAMMVTTIGIVAPLCVSLGFDIVWLGVFMTIIMELGLITPPVGLNLYVVQSIRGGSGSMIDVYIGVIPFVVAMLLALAVLIYFPGIALWLPNLLF